MKESSSKLYYLEYASLLLLILSFVFLISAFLGNTKDKKEINEEVVFSLKSESIENTNISHQYNDHISALKNIGFKMLDMNLNSSIAYVYVDKNLNAYRKLQELYPQCIVVEFKDKYQIFIDKLFIQKIATNHVVPNMQGKYYVQYVVENLDKTWAVKLNNKVYTNENSFDNNLRIIEVTNSFVLLEADQEQIYKIIL